MSNYVFVVFIILASRAQAETLSKSGIPRLVRSSPRTEVFFTDLKDSYWIAQDSKHNILMKEFMDAAKKNKSISFQFDEDSRKIISTSNNALKETMPTVNIETTESTGAGSTVSPAPASSK